MKKSRKQRRTTIILVVYLIILLPIWILSGCSQEEKHDFWAKTYGGSGSDGAHSIQYTSDGGFIVAGFYAVAEISHSFGDEYYPDFWVLKLNASGLLEWQRIYGGIWGDSAGAIQQTSDGGFIVSGGTSSYGAGESDMWVLKISSRGQIQWQKTYGGVYSDGASSIQQTVDGGYISVGGTISFGMGKGDVWILKLTSDGQIAWQNTYGDAEYDKASSFQQTQDGGYIIAGSTSSFGYGDSDAWVFKLSSSGSIEWQKTYGGIDTENIISIQQTSDGGYVIGGDTLSFGAGSYDIWVLRLTSDGEIEWQKTYGGLEYDSLGEIRVTSEGGFLAVGRTKSFGSGWGEEYDIWVLKLTSDGQIEWQKTYGGKENDYGYSVRETPLGFILAGETASFGRGFSDILVLSLDSNGIISESCPSLIGLDSTAIVEDTNITVSDSFISVRSTEAVVTESEYETRGSQVSVETICTRDLNDNVTQ